MSAKLKTLVQRIARRMGLRRRIDVGLCPSLFVPIVVGIVRPLLILSPNALTCLSPRQLEAVIAHELAHIRRYDAFVNLLQTLLETLLFYHPAMWWVSRRVREERENCCDDLAVALTGDRATYAEMLFHLEKSRPVPRLAVAATGGSLLKRVRRLAFSEDSSSGKSDSALLGGMMMVLFSSLMLICLAALNGISFAAADVAESSDGPAAVSPSPELPQKNARPAPNRKKADPRPAEKPSYDAEGFTLLHRAAIGGRSEQVSSLIDDGVDVDVPQRKFHGTPLQYAAARGHKDVVELLIAAGASIDSADTTGRTPLMWAASEKRTEIVKLLLKHKADVNAQTNTGWTPFRYAVQTEDAELIKLFKGKVNFDQLDPEGFSILHQMASGGHSKSVKALVDAGADVNVRQKTHQGTPLQYAANNGHLEVVQILLKGKAAVDAADSIGRTPLMWAATSGKKDVAEALLSAGAKVNQTTNTGWTALRMLEIEATTKWWNCSSSTMRSTKRLKSE